MGDDIHTKQTVHIKNCKDAQITIPGKVKCVSMTDCHNTTVNLGGVITSVRVDKCNHVTLNANVIDEASCKSFQIERSENIFVQFPGDRDAKFIMAECEGLKFQVAEDESTSYSVVYTDEPIQVVCYTAE